MIYTESEAKEILHSELKEQIKGILNYENDLNAKLDMLTSISTTTTNDDVWNASEEVRDELCKGTGITTEEIRNSLQGKNVTTSIEQGPSDEDSESNGFGLFT
jgi:uncharacterized coiled-coil DUF342 family protein